jgi:hypothetical protein
VCTTPLCDIPIPADDARARICTSCTSALRHDLAQVDDVLRELEVTTTKQDRIGDPGPRSSEVPLPYRPEASEHADHVHTSLVVWARAIADACNVPVWELPVESPAELARWLLRHGETIRQYESAGDMVVDIERVMAGARRAVDKPVVRTYLGPCECGDPDPTSGRPVELYAHPRARQITCPACGAAHDVAARRAWLLGAVEDALVCAEDLSRGLPGLLDDTKALTVAMIHGWAAAGRLAAHPPHPSQPSRPLYRTGDVIDVLSQVRADRADRKARRARRQERAA